MSCQNEEVEDIQDTDEMFHKFCGLAFQICASKEEAQQTIVFVNVNS
jgi:hypothetical protein